MAEFARDASADPSHFHGVDLATSGADALDLRFGKARDVEHVIELKAVIRQRLFCPVPEDIGFMRCHFAPLD
jgi:hypothetical protein